LSIIDTITTGFNTVARKIWLAAIPIVLDVFLWLGPKVSIGPVMAQTAEMLRSAAGSIPSNVVAPEGTTELAESMLELLQTTLGKFNLLALLAWGRLGVPSIAGIKPIEPDAHVILEASSYGQMFLYQVLILAAGLFIACSFLALLAQTLRGHYLAPADWLRTVCGYWVNMAIIFVPLSMILVFAVSFSIILGPFGVFTLVLVLWVVLYLSFVPQAVTLGQMKPLAALASSFTVVRVNFWSTLGLILTVNVINTGLGLIWQRLIEGSAVLTVVAILGNAFVGTALTLALFIFFQTRMHSLRESIEKARSA